MSPFYVLAMKRWMHERNHIQEQKAKDRKKLIKLMEKGEDALIGLEQLKSIGEPKIEITADNGSVPSARRRQELELSVCAMLPYMVCTYTQFYYFSNPILPGRTK